MIVGPQNLERNPATSKLFANARFACVFDLTPMLCPHGASPCLWLDAQHGEPFTGWVRRYGKGKIVFQAQVFREKDQYLAARNGGVGEVQERYPATALLMNSTSGLAVLWALTHSASAPSADIAASVMRWFRLNPSSFRYSIAGSSLS